MQCGCMHKNGSRNHKTFLFRMTNTSRALLFGIQACFIAAAASPLADFSPLDICLEGYTYSVMAQKDQYG